jgi:hypothetical protein
MNEREYNRLKSEIEAEYRRKLDALELVWKMSNSSRNGTQAIQAVNGVVGKGRLLKAVRHSLTELRGDFTLHEVENQIRLVNPTLAATIKRPSLSSALKRLAKEGVIIVVSVGAGKKPSKYRVGSVAPT